MTTVPRNSPFAGIPITDYLRDAAALVLLLVSFAFPWTRLDAATQHVEVILITLLSVFSLAITYLARAGVFPPTVTVNTVWMLRLLVNVPYLVLVLVFVIIDAASGASSTTGGVGLGAAFGLAGAILAAQPRDAETRAFVSGAPIGELWYRIVIGFGAVAIIAGVVNLILVLVDIGRFGASGALFDIVTALVNLAAVGLLYGSVIRRSEVGRLVGIAVGSAVLGAVFIDLFTRFAISGGVESLHWDGLPLLFLSALAGLASAPAVRIAMHPADPLRRWLDASAVTLLVTTGLAAFITFHTIIRLVAGDRSYVGFGIGSIVVVVGIGLVAVVARSMLIANPTTSRALVLMLTALMVLLGIVHIVLQVNSGYGLDIVDLVVAFGLPLAVAGFLTVPAAVRAFYGVAAAPGTAHPTFVERLAHPGGAPAAPAAAPTAPAAPAAAGDAVARIALALDPATPAATLFQLAQDEPMLRQYIAANPSTYPDLLNWLGSLGDPAIDAALNAR